MPKNYTLSYLIVPILLSVSPCSFGQSQLKNITKTFDEIVGQENLNINNGIFNLQDYPYVVPNQTKYFLKKGYSKGNVTYNGQPYYDVKLKYDLNQDILVYKPQNSGSNIGCNLIPQKVDSFSLYGKKFVYLNLPRNAPNPGYYQKVEMEKEFIFYIKFHKTRSDKIIGDKLYYFYQPDNEFWLHYQNAYSEISSINDVLEVFPDFSKKIKDFYDTKELLRTTDPPLFYQKLMVYINDLLGN